MKTRRTQAMQRKSNVIIAENQDETYYRYQMFPKSSQGDLELPVSNSEIRYSFYDDIARIYDLPRKHLGYHLQNYSIEILRSLVVFGEHQHIIDEIRLRHGDSF